MCDKNTLAVYVGHFGTYKPPFPVALTKRGAIDKRQKRYREIVNWIDAQEAEAIGVSVEQLRKDSHGA